MQLPPQSRSFTGVVADLHLADPSPVVRPRGVDAAALVTTRCPCGCVRAPAFAPSVRTREWPSGQLHVLDPDLLVYRGRRYGIEHVAPIWKKDCRTWLWKNVRHERKQRRDELLTRLQLASVDL